MKSILISSLLTLTLLPTSAFAEVGWTGTALWQSPVPANTVIHVVVPSGAELAKACGEFRQLNQAYAKFSLDERKKVFEVTRRESLPSHFPEPTFAFEFKTDFIQGANLLSSLSDEARQELANAVSDKAHASILPFSVQMPSEVVLQDLSGVRPTQISSGEFSKLGTELGVTPLDVHFNVKNGGEVVLHVSGLDTACDLFQGNLQGSAKISANAFLDLDEGVKISAFYGTLADIANPVLKKYAKPNQRAAVLGYRFGKELELQFPSNDLVQNDAVLSYLIDTYFDSITMDFNGLWSVPNPASGEYWISFQSESAPFSMQLLISAKAGGL